MMTIARATATTKAPTMVTRVPTMVADDWQQVVVDYYRAKVTKYTYFNLLLLFSLIKFRMQLLDLCEKYVSFVNFF